MTAKKSTTTKKPNKTGRTSTSKPKKSQSNESFSSVYFGGVWGMLKYITSVTTSLIHIFFLRKK